MTKPYEGECEVAFNNALFAVRYTHDGSSELSITRVRSLLNQQDVRITDAKAMNIITMCCDYDYREKVLGEPIPDGGYVRAKDIGQEVH